MYGIGIYLYIENCITVYTLWEFFTGLYAHPYGTLVQVKMWWFRRTKGMDILWRVNSSLIFVVNFCKPRAKCVRIRETILCNRAIALEDVSPQGHFIVLRLDASHAIDSCVLLFRWMYTTCGTFVLNSIIKYVKIEGLFLLFSECSLMWVVHVELFRGVTLM